MRFPVQTVSIKEWIDYCHGQSVDMGWHDEPREVGTLLMLIVSEIVEAWEGYRRNLKDDHLPDRPMIEVELADAMIRICDLAGYLKLDLEGAMRDKMKYNKTRADHQPENRKLENGKRF